MDPSAPRNKAEKNINICHKETHIQMKSSRTKETSSCFFQHPLLVAFRAMNGRSMEDYRACSHFSVFSCITCAGEWFNHTKAAIISCTVCAAYSDTLVSTCLGVLWLTPNCAYQITSWKIIVVENWNSNKHVNFQIQRKAVLWALNQ